MYLNRDQSLKCKMWSYKTCKKKSTGENLWYLGLDKEFSDSTSKKRSSIKGKIDKLDFVKIKNFYYIKDIDKRMKKHSVD